MGADLVVNWSCRAKAALGDGDVSRGTARMLALLKMRQRAEAAIALSPDVPPEDVEFTVLVMGPSGPQEQRVKARVLLEQARALDAHEAGCAQCPANVSGRPFGCAGYVRYPISAETEGALLDALEPAETFGGDLFLRALRDFGYDGAPMAQWRQRGLLAEDGERTRAMTPEVTASSAMILQALLTVGTHLEATHALLVLMWLGRLAIDGEVPRSPDDPSPLIAVTRTEDVAERAARFGLRRVGEPVADELVTLLHAGGVLGVGLVVDA